MLVSIITPTLNSAKYLRQTIKSIKKQCGEYNLEHIVVDGGSEDETASIVENEGLSKFYVLKGSSMYEAIDFGFKKSSGDILCWLNSDDLYMPDTVKIVSNLFNTNKELKIIAGGTMYINASDNEMYEYKYPPIPLRLLKSFDTLYLCQPSIFWRREVYFETGGLNLSYKIIADRDFVLRAAEKYGLVNVDFILSKFRLHSDNLSKHKLTIIKKETSLMNKELGIGVTSLFNGILSIAGHFYIKAYNPGMILWKVSTAIKKLLRVNKKA